MDRRGDLEETWLRVDSVHDGSMGPFMVLVLLVDGSTLEQASIHFQPLGSGCQLQSFLPPLLYGCERSGSTGKRGKIARFCPLEGKKKKSDLENGQKFFSV